MNVSAGESAGRLVVGTSGFSYADWKGSFYPEGLPQSRWLEHYAENFSAVELNVTFYRLPSRETFAEWSRRTPAGFEFVVKGSRVITHYRRLRDVAEPLGALFSASAPLGAKRSCMLWQLPPKMAPDPEALARFCDLLSELGGGKGGLRHAFEFRDPRWFAEEVTGILRAHRHALVVADPPRAGEPRELTADFAYLRFHHGRVDGVGYDADQLAEYVAYCRRWLDTGADVLAFFNNDPGGWAVRNAREFRTALEPVGARARSPVTVAL